MKKISFFILSLILMFGLMIGANANERPDQPQQKFVDTFAVLGNGGRGTNSGYPEDAIHWYQENFPTLPLDYISSQPFIHYEPLVHYVDNVNWSLFPLNNFEKVSKNRWVRIPEGTKIKRDSKTEVWEWPVGAETAKILGGTVMNPDGTTRIEDFELRLARKLRNDESGKSVWAMATYIKNPSGSQWQVVMPPELELNIPNAVSNHGKTRAVSYALSSPGACMTCHVHGSYSNVDYKRGDEYVYGVNEEILSGLIKMRLSEYLASQDIQRRTRELDRSVKDDWVKLDYLDKSVLNSNRVALAGLFK